MVIFRTLGLWKYYENGNFVYLYIYSRSSTPFSCSYFAPCFLPSSTLSFISHPPYVFTFSLSASSTFFPYLFLILYRNLLFPPPAAFRSSTPYASSRLPGCSSFINSLFLLRFFFSLLKCSWSERDN